MEKFPLNLALYFFPRSSSGLDADLGAWCSASGFDADLGAWCSGNFRAPGTAVSEVRDGTVVSEFHPYPHLRVVLLSAVWRLLPAVTTPHELRETMAVLFPRAQNSDSLLLTRECVVPATTGLGVDFIGHGPRTHRRRARIDSDVRPKAAEAAAATHE